MKKVISRVKNTKIFLLMVGIVDNPVFINSAIMIVGSNAINAIAYVYHLIIGRLLGPESYGVLASALSLITILSTTYSFLGLVIVKVVSRRDQNKTYGLLKWFEKRTLAIGIVLTLIVIVFDRKIATFLHIDPDIVWLISLIFLVSIVSFVYRSFLQGMLKFGQLVIVGNLDIGLRLILGVTLIYFGYSVSGAVFAIFLSSFIALYYAYIFINRVYKESGQFNNPNAYNNTYHPGSIKKIVSFTFPVFAVTLASTSFFTTDLLMTKHFFDAYDAGIFSALSAMGRIILFAVGPISSVMFPMISKKYSKKEPFGKVFFLSFLLTSIIAFSVLIIYSLFPTFSMQLLFGQKYVSGAVYLPWYGLFMVIFTLSSVLMNFFLSLEKNISGIFGLLGAIIQAVGIWLFHDSIFQVISISIFASSLLLGSLIIYFVYEFKGSFRRL